MNPATLAALVGAALVELGLYGLVVNPHPLRKLPPSTWWAAAFRLRMVARRSAAAGLAFDLFRKRWSLRHCRGVRRERARGRAGAASVPDERARRSRSGRVDADRRRQVRSHERPLAHDAGRLAARHRDPPACCRDHSVVRSRRTPCTAHRRAWVPAAARSPA